MTDSLLFSQSIYRSSELQSARLQGAEMSSWSEVRIGRLSYGGSQRGAYDPQSELFNRDDLTRVGTPGDPAFRHVYQVTVEELRRRLEALGYSLEAIRQSLVETLKPQYRDLSATNDEIPYRAFLDFACSRTVADLVEIVRQWNETEIGLMGRELTLEESNRRFNPNFDVLPAALITFLQGSSPDLLLDDTVHLSGHAFERLLCEVHDPADLYEYDLTAVLAAGYFSHNQDPVGNAYDDCLGQRNPDAFVRGNRLIDEESETLEFKSVVSSNVSKTIADQIPKYLVGFLNQTGGKILFGISDNGIVEGIPIRRDQRDELHRRIAAACVEVTPSISLNDIGVRFRPVIGAAHYVEECFVVEVEVPAGIPHEMYFKGSQTWVRFGPETRNLTGHQLFTHILAAYHNVRELKPRRSAPPS
ncbi:ATP-binding protein [Rhodanobacter glycinis]|uniref:ATP-binding protein n=1 Tax=Rhodanobacter glycinis TaxID=582702 RepID=A0A502C8Q6_9GAMM|nr:RNA-binding domain-containing protein [Rhodanobacter glycinis]TPG08141.1 ATP-binding protein [Rhodanobacter glycinis]